MTNQKPVKFALTNQNASSHLKRHPEEYTKFKIESALAQIMESQLNENIEQVDNSMEVKTSFSGSLLELQLYFRMIMTRWF